MYLEILSKNNTIKKSTSLMINIISCAILALFTNYTLQYFHATSNFLSAIWWVTEHPATFLIGSLFIFFIYIFVLSLFANLYLTSFICLAIFCAMGFSNTNKLTILGEPLYPVDFYQIRYINSLYQMIGGRLSIFTILFCLMFTFLLIFILKRLPKLPLNITTRLIMLCLSSYMIYSYLTFNNNIMNKLITKSGVNVVLWNQPYNYDTNGFVFGLLSNLQTEIMEQPEEYNHEKMIEICDQLIKQSEVINKQRSNSVAIKNPNIIFIMSEAFWDPTRITTLTFSEDPMKNIREIMNPNSSGWLLSPEFGGNTANVEFEALTGLSMYNLIPGSIPYQQSMDKDGTLPSLVSMLKEKGYDTLAFHPYNKSFYKRNRVYKYLGFDEFIGEEDMHSKDYLSKDSYISDQSVVNEILYKLQIKDTPLFIHTVTMQNHLPLYDGKHGSNTISIQGLDDTDLTKELETYTEGVKKTDLAIKNLILSLSKLQEPTIVVFWGDHLPAISNSIYKESNYAADASYESYRLLSETPIFIYSNFKTEKRELKTISPAFLGITIYDLLGLPVNPYYALLENLEAISPGLNTSVLINSDGNIKNQLGREEESLLRDYKLIQYDLLVGKKYSLPLLFK